jgi:hypothetical protein
MQAFHDQLFSLQTQPTPYFHGLIRITQIGLQEMMAIRSEITWNLWG